MKTQYVAAHHARQSARRKNLTTIGFVKLVWIKALVSNNLIDWIGDPEKCFADFRKALDLSPTEAARALGVTYDTYKDWQSGRRKPSTVVYRCIELLLMYPRTAKRFARRP